MGGPALTPARRAAYRILHQVALGNTDPASLLHGDPTRGLRPADLDLATEIVYGVLRLQNRLDYILEGCARRPAAQIDLPVRLTLRIGLYQILFLSRVPARAAVDEAVKTARLFAPRGATSFVNGVLRAVCRNPALPALPSRDETPLSYLTITLSHPEWLARRYLERLSLDRAEARCLRHNRPPPTDLRLEPPLDLEEARQALERDGVVTEPLSAIPGCLRVRSGKPKASSLYRSGSVFIQEGGSQLIPRLLGLQADECVLDACAAPGAKATEISKWCQRVYAVEKHPKRLALMASLLKRFGCENVLAVGGDAEKLPFRIQFPAILLDAPCSNLGTIARNPDIKWRLQEPDLVRLATTQRRLLESCSRFLATPGRLVYATCSTEPEENENVVHGFLNEHPEFRLAPPPDSFPEQALKMVGDDRTLRTFPERDAMDGYYAVILEKRP